MALAIPVKRTAMYHSHAAKGATFVDRDGWHMPAWYTSVDQEVEMARSTGGMCDISPVGKLDLQGTEVLGQLTDILDLSNTLEVGQSQRCPNPVSGAVQDETLTAAGLSYDEALVLTPQGNVASVASFLEGRLDGCAHLVDVTSSRAGIWVIGPLGHRVLSKLVELDLDPTLFADGSCVQGKAAEVHVMVLRSDIAGLLGYQLYVTRDFGEYLWNALLHAGHREGVGPLGIEALEQIQSAPS